MTLLKASSAVLTAFIKGQAAQPATLALTYAYGRALRRVDQEHEVMTKPKARRAFEQRLRGLANRHAKLTKAQHEALLASMVEGYLAEPTDETDDEPLLPYEPRRVSVTARRKAG